MTNLNKVDLSYQTLLVDLLESLLKNSLDNSKSETNLCKEIHELTAAKIVGIFNQNDEGDNVLSSCHPVRRDILFDEDIVQTFLYKAFNDLKMFYWNYADECENDDNDVYADDRIIKNFIAVPLFADKELIGMLVVLNFSLTDNVDSLINIMDMLSKILGLMLKNIHVIEEKEQLYNELIESETKFKSIVNNALDIVYIMKLNTSVTYLSPSAYTILGYEEGDLIGRSFLNYVHRDDLENATKGLAFLFEKKKNPKLDTNIVFELRILNSQDEYIWFSIRSNIIKIKNEDCLLGIARDITNEKRLEETLRTHATYDDMTGLLNRRAGLEKLEYELLSADNNDRYLSIIFIDLNDLKIVNDNLGHDQGDFYIVNSGKIMKSILRNMDSVCRMGGDEFMIILPHCNADNAERTAQRLILAFDSFNKLHQKEIDLSISYGCATFTPDEPENSALLIQIADQNMYDYKRLYKEEHPLELD